MNNATEVYEVARVNDKHLVNHRLDDIDDEEYHGWVHSTIRTVDVTDGGRIEIIIEHPWGETCWYSWDSDTIIDGTVSTICDEYGYLPSEFRKLEGEKIWLKVDTIGTDDAGEVTTHTRISYERVTSGPYAWKPKLLRAGLVLLVIVSLPPILILL